MIQSVNSLTPFSLIRTRFLCFIMSSWLTWVAITHPDAIFKQSLHTEFLIETFPRSHRISALLVIPIHARLVMAILNLGILFVVLGMYCDFVPDKATESVTAVVGEVESFSHT